MANQLENKIAQFAATRNLFDTDTKILLAVSGGADSVAMTVALNNIAPNNKLIIAHINHNLRGQSSDIDEEFVIDLAKKLNLDIHTRSVDVKSFAARQKLSIETAARILRLKNLVEIARQADCNVIATAHHADDNAETVIHRLLRGTGYRGLAGIHPKKIMQIDTAQSTFIRPLLCVTRSEIIEYCTANNLQWRHDHTNDDYAHTRNKIRHLLLPQLQSECKTQLTRQLSKLSDISQKLIVKVETQAQTAWKNTVTKQDIDNVTFDKKTFANLPPIIAVELTRRALVHLGSGQKNLTQLHYKNILQLPAAKHSTKFNLPEGLTASANKQSIILQRTQNEDQSKTAKSQPLNIPGKTIFADYTIHAKLLDPADCNIEKFKSQKDNSIEWFDYDKLTLPLIAGTRKPGDRFHPLGMKTEKKIGKYITAARITPQSRNKLFVIEDAEKIIWLAPQRPSQLTTIDSQTKKILQITVTSHPTLLLNK